MSQSLNSRVILILCSSIAAILAPIVGTLVGQSNYTPLIIAAGAIFSCVFLVIPSTWMWMITLGSIFMTGDLTFLPVPVKLFELLALFSCARFAVENIIFRKAPIRIGPTIPAILLFSFFLIFLTHAFSDRMGLKALGSSIWGGRGYVAVVIGIGIYISVLSSRLSTSQLKALPLIALIFATLQVSIQIITALVPASTILIYRVYSGVYGSDNEFSTRLGFLGSFGSVLLLWSLSKCRVQDVLRNGRVVIALALILGIACCFASGYRSTIAIGALLCLVAFYRDLRLRMIIPATLALAVFFSLIWYHSSVERLPRAIQRGLVILPGDWDRDVVQDASDSNEFRISLWQYWSNYYFGRAMWLGRGLGFSSSEAAALGPVQNLDLSGQILPAFSDRDEYFAITGNLHNGLLSAVDRFGIIGAFLILLWIIMVFRHALRSLLKPGPIDPVSQWLALYIIVYTLSYFPGALRIEDFLPSYLLIVGLLISTRNQETSLENRNRQSAIGNRS